MKIKDGMQSISGPARGRGMLDEDHTGRTEDAGTEVLNETPRSNGAASPPLRQQHGITKVGKQL